MPGLNQRHRSQPRQNRSPLQHGRATVNKGRAKTDVQNRRPKQIYPTLGRLKLAVLQSPPKLPEIRMGRAADRSFQLSQAIPAEHDQTNLPRPKGGTLALHSKAVSAALVVERKTDGTRKQYPVYFASEALAGSKLHYS